jgi:hypothetical protein
MPKILFQINLNSLKTGDLCFMYLEHPESTSLIDTDQNHNKYKVNFGLKPQMQQFLG